MGNTIENVYSTGSGRQVIAIYIGNNDVNANNVQIESNTVSGVDGEAAARGILAYGNDIQVLNNNVSNISSPTTANCVYLKADNSLIDNNVLHNCGSNLNASGDLTIKDITRPVTLKVEFNGISKSPYGFSSAGFSASTKINRRDWGLTWNQTLETGGVLVGEDIQINIELELIQE